MSLFLIGITLSYCNTHTFRIDRDLQLVVFLRVAVDRHGKNSAFAVLRELLRSAQLRKVGSAFEGGMKWQ